MSIQKRIWQSKIRNLPKDQDFSPAEAESPDPMKAVEKAMEEIIELDEEKKATMVSNLLVVLTSDKDVSPIVNTGTIY